MKRKYPIGMSIALILILASLLLHSSQANSGRPLTTAEMTNAFGRCPDCTGTWPDSDECSDEECPGCVNGNDCGEVSLGSGNTLWKCTSESTPDAFCRENGLRYCIDSTHFCRKVGSPSSGLQCGPNGNCIEGSQDCVECTESAIKGYDQRMSYDCY